MKYISYLLAITVMLANFSLKAQQFTPDQERSTIKFIITNLGFDVTGTLNGLQGSIRFDEKNLSSSSVNVSVNAASVDTDNSTRDKHLRGDDYFAVKTYPQIRLTSVKIAKSVTPGYYVLFAKLTIKETTKEISFPFTAVPEAGAYRFKGEFSIKRRDFGIGGKNTISNDLKVKLDVLTKK
jgi:polyisoprenoid-binding protein YceI